MHRLTPTAVCPACPYVRICVCALHVCVCALRARACARDVCVCALHVVCCVCLCVCVSASVVVADRPSTKTNSSYMCECIQARKNQMTRCLTWQCCKGPCAPAHERTHASLASQSHVCRLVCRAHEHSKAAIISSMEAHVRIASLRTSQAICACAHRILAYLTRNMHMCASHPCVPHKQYAHVRIASLRTSQAICTCAHRILAYLTSNMRMCASHPCTCNKQNDLLCLHVDISECA
jgi:hypothetical protein